jgi:hypothetical protein
MGVCHARCDVPHPADHGGNCRDARDPSPPSRVPSPRPAGPDAANRRWRRGPDLGAMVLRSVRQVVARGPRTRRAHHPAIQRTRRVEGGRRQKAGRRSAEKTAERSRGPCGTNQTQTGAASDSRRRPQGAGPDSRPASSGIAHVRPSRPPGSRAACGIRGAAARDSGRAARRRSPPRDTRPCAARIPGGWRATPSARSRTRFV